MSIIRRKRETWTTIPNEILNDDRLTLDGLGMLVYMLSKPDNWTFSQERLGDRFCKGREAMRSIMRNLQDCGYVRRELHRDEKGHIKTITIVSETAARDDRHTGQPEPGQPEAANPPPGEPVTIVKTETTVMTDQVMTLFPAEQSPTEKPQKPAKEETALQTACRETWKSYSEAFFNRYGTEPVRNAKVSTAIKGFVQRVGHTEAPLIAAFYVGHNNAFYVRQCHDTGMLLKDSEKLRTEWATNTRVTNKAANEADRMQGQGDMYARIAAKIKRGEL